jgi:hypothetical protein
MKSLSYVMIVNKIQRISIFDLIKYPEISVKGPN